MDGGQLRGCFDGYLLMFDVALIPWDDDYHLLPS
jgi:hypothetical protein